MSHSEALGLDEARKRQMWGRWKAGESISAIARALGKSAGSVHNMLKAKGGIAPPHRRRSQRALSFAEREEISRGLARGDSGRAIASRLKRPASTVSREVARNGGRERYRASKAERRAWREAKRPKSRLLSTNAHLRDVVANKLQQDWSPEQVSGWLLRCYPNDGTMRVSHETIYRTLFVQAKGALKKELVAHLRSNRVEQQGDAPLPKRLFQGRWKGTDQGRRLHQAKTPRGRG